MMRQTVIVLLGLGMLIGACAQRYDFVSMYGEGDAAGDVLQGDADIGMPDVPSDGVAVDAADAPGDLPPELGPDIFDAIDITPEIPDVLEITPEIGPDVCVPNCEGKACGDDGCDGLCGEESQCDDGQFCNGVESCDPDTGNCLDGDAPVVNDGIECTVDECDEDSDEVTNLPDDEVCADQNPCTVDLCAPDSEESDEAGCTNLAEADGPVDGCDDGNPCTDDLCETGECVSTLLPLEELTVEVEECLCGKDADCDELNDEDLCNGSLYCELSPDDGDVKVCQVDPATVVVCADEYFCNGAETCAPETGDCVAGIAPELDDNVDCTVDSCDDELDKVVHVPTDELCDDKFFCNGVETCDMFAGCQDGLEPNGEDGIPCTMDECNEALDDFDHTPDDAACDDELHCNGPEVCDLVNGCGAGVAPDVSDGVECTVDTCDEEADGAVHTPNDGLCDDQNECTSDWCDGDSDCQNQARPDGSICKAGQGSWQCTGGECACQPNCTDRQCGTDGCGGSCGDCAEDTECNSKYGVCAQNDWVVVPAGNFMMGTPGDENCRVASEGPRHQVELTRAMLVSDHELTQEEWLAVVPDGTPNPSYFGPDGPLPACTEADCPLERANFYEMMHLANLKSETEGLEKCYVLGGCTGEFGSGCPDNETMCGGDYVCSNYVFKGLGCLGYRLPTEAEWEYLARAGTDLSIPWPLPGGSDMGPDCLEGGEAQTSVAWFKANSGGFSHPTRSLAANGFGLYDILGNVYERVFDEWEEDYWNAGSVDPIAANGSDMYVSVRGGCLDASADTIRSGYRAYYQKDLRHNLVGTRLLRTLPAPVCEPDCTGRECGNDGCGGSCGVCDTGSCDDGYGTCISDGWVIVPSGSFVMGSPADEPCRDPIEGPLHKVTITHPMLVSDHETTQGEWLAVAGSPNPAHFGPNGPSPDCTSPDCPVELVNWFEALQFANDMSALEGLEACYELTGCSGTLGGGCKADENEAACDGDFVCTEVTFTGVDCTGYRLPTEAEIEYFTRASTSTMIPYPPPEGSMIALDQAKCTEQAAAILQLDTYVWHWGNSDFRTHEVAGLSPNGWGLYDTLGNVREWTFDAIDSGFYENSPPQDPTGPPTVDLMGQQRIARGASYTSPRGHYRSAHREWPMPEDRWHNLGFRLVRSLPTADCIHDCANRECGDDGCGGSCGSCAGGEVCLEEFGACQPDQWVEIPGGTFIMGAPEDENCSHAGEWPQHEVAITRPMLVSDHPVTNGEWELVTGMATPSYHKGLNLCADDECPVERVNRHEAMQFTNALSKLHGLEACYELSGCTGILGGGCGLSETYCDAKTNSDIYECDDVEFMGPGCAGYRLSTEAEWEYTARAGTVTALPFPPPLGGGKSAECDYPGGYQGTPPEPNLAKGTWYLSSSGGKTRPVRSLAANAWGLYDALGNVLHWVGDDYDGGSPYGAEPQVDPLGFQPEEGQFPFAMSRGCGHNSTPNYCRSAKRSYLQSDFRLGNTGFRVFRSLLCRDGEAKSCGTDEGTCISGLRFCTDGTWGECLGGTGPDGALCDGNQCGGDDGCGGTCGTCPEGYSCDEDYFVCVPPGFVAIPGGSFTMGSPDADDPGGPESCREEREGPLHEVAISRAMLVSDHEVTNEEWETATGGFTPSYFGPQSKFPDGVNKCPLGDCPLESVNWFEALEYCNALSLAEGLELCYELECSGEMGTGCKVDYDCVGDYDCSSIQFSGLDCTGYRLPTEAEWEYFARAGTNTPYAWPPAGGELDIEVGACGTCTDYPELSAFAWYCGNNPHAERTAQLAPNAWGLHDTIGNVGEWCFDRFTVDYYLNSPDVDPYNEAPFPVEARVIRGGHFGSAASGVRSASRDVNLGLNHRSRYNGFRVVRSIE